MLDHLAWRHPTADTSSREAQRDLLTMEAQYCSHGYTKHYTEVLKLFERCEGSFIDDGAGTPFLDLQIWYSAVNFDYANPRLNEALKRQIDRLPSASPTASRTSASADWCCRLARITSPALPTASFSSAGRAGLLIRSSSTIAITSSRWTGKGRSSLTASSYSPRQSRQGRSPRRSFARRCHFMPHDRTGTQMRIIPGWAVLADAIWCRCHPHAESSP